MATMPFQDATLTPEQRAGDLLARLTVEEKAGQLTQYFYMTGGDPSEVVDNPESSSEAGAAQTGAVEAELARGRVGSLLFLREANQINRLQKLAIEGNRWGIPLIFGFDVIHGLRTVAPVPIALAASWSPETIEDAQAVAASEARATGIHWAFAPMVDIARDPRWGRIIEGAGEDVLGAAVAAAQVRGFQGEGRPRAASTPTALSRGRSTSPATARPWADATTKTPTSPTRNCTTSTCLPSRGPSTPARATS